MAELNSSELFEADGSLPNVVAEELRSLIVRGTLLPGEHLGQTELANRFGRSKVPIREALKRLATEGFLLHDRNRGYFVAPLDFAEAIQLYKLRRWLESEMLKTARWPDANEIAEFRRKLDALPAIDLRADFQEWLRALEKLRYAIFDLSPEKLLLREALRLWNLTDRYRAFFPRNEEESIEGSLVDALERRDRDELLKQYHAARDRIDEVLRQVFDTKFDQR
jgi:DNA-binding GntR family transcriptional regulator